MNATLLKQFLMEECTPYVRSLLLEALAGPRAGSAAQKQRFELNRFEVTLDFEENVAVLEDVLDTSESGVQRVPIAELAAAMKQSA